VKEMNEAFKEEIAEMESEARTAQELEECYYSVNSFFTLFVIKNIKI